jgi:hypothetical protein
MGAVVASRTFFWCCAPFLILLRLNNLIKFYFFPIKPFARKLLHKKFTFFSDNHYVVGFIVEGMPINILWDNQQRLTNPILVVILYICLEYQNLTKDKYNLYGVISTDYDGTLFSEKR